MVQVVEDYHSWQLLHGTLGHRCLLGNVTQVLLQLLGGLVVDAKREDLNQIATDSLVICPNEETHLKVAIASAGLSRPDRATRNSASFLAR